MHEINGRVFRNEARLKVLFEVQKERGRKVQRRPYKGVVTRWNSEHEEVKHTNIFMGDYQLSLSRMFADDGIDRGLLHEGVGVHVDKMRFMFSQTDQMILRQFECAAEPAVLLSKFFQLNIPTAHLVLFHLRVRIAQMRQPSFMMYGDLSHSSLPVILP